MMKYLFFCVGCLLMRIAIAQKHTVHNLDYAKIKQVTQNQASKQYYPVLLKRYEANDTRLTRDDYRYLYYGHLFQNGYKPYDTHVLEDSAKLLLVQQPSIEGYQHLKRISTKILGEHPFALRYIWIMVVASEHLNQSEELEKWSYKYNTLVNTILSSGDGLHESTAWHVIDVDHEYDLLDALELQANGYEHLKNKNVDYVKVKPNDKGATGFYFDVDQLFDAVGATKK